MRLFSETSDVIEIHLTFGGVSNVYPDGVTSAFWVNDNPTKGNVDLMQYIKIGDKTAREIVTANQNGTTSYKGVDFPMNFGGAFAPIGVLVDGNGIIRIKVLTAYCAFNELEITLLGGLRWTASDSSLGVVTLITSQDRAFHYYKGQFLEKLDRIAVDDKAKIEVKSTDSNGAVDLWLTFDGVEEVRAIDVDKDESGNAKNGYWVNDNAKGYSGSDYSRGVDLMEYILINGRTAREIVMDNHTGKTAFKGGAAPLSYGGIYAPVGVCVMPDGVFRIVVLNEYCNYVNLRITLKAGLQWKVLNEENAQFDTALVTEQDTTFHFSGGNIVRWDTENDCVYLDDSVQVNKAGELEDCNVYQIRFNKTFNEKAEWLMDKQTENPLLYALQNVIAINGKTVKQINDETDDSAYEYKTTVVNWESHKVPVRVLFDYANGKTLFTVYVHKNHVAENAVDTISLKAFDWTHYSVKYTLKEEMDFKSVSEDDGAAFKQICYVTFEDGEKVSVLKGEKLTAEQIPEDLSKESTEETEYIFDGWYYTNVNGVEMKFEPAYSVVDGNYALYGKFTETARKYTITYLDKDGNVYQTQEVRKDETITLIAVPEIAHYTGAWVYQGEGVAPVVMPAGNIAFQTTYQLKVYKVTFYADENAMYELKTVEYTIEDTDIEEPSVAVKEGFTGVWEAYELTGGDVDVKPIYTEIPAKLNGCGASVNVGFVMGTVVLLGGLLLRKKKEIK